MNILDIFCNTSNKYEPEHDEENKEILKKDKATNTNTNDNIDIHDEIAKLNKKNIYFLKYKRRTSLIIKKKKKLSYRKFWKCCCYCYCKPNTKKNE